MSEVRVPPPDEILPVPEFPDPKRDPKQTHIGGWFPLLNPTQQKVFDDTARFILCFGEKGCRTADAIIYTGSGLKRLGAIRPPAARPGFNPINQDVIAFDGTGAIPSTADLFWVEPSRDAIRSVLANGAEVIGSHRHPMWVCWQSPEGHGFGYKTLSQIMSGLALGHRFWTPLIGQARWTVGRRKVGDVELSASLAYSIGALVGDGSLNISTGDQSRSVGFTNMDPECICETEKGLAEIGCKFSKQSRQYSYLVLGPKGVIKGLIRSLGIDKLSYFKRIPDAIIESPRSVICSFLSGLFDTDGTVDKVGNVAFCTVSEDLGKDVQNLLACLGILCIRRFRKSASGRPTWTLSMMGRHACEFGVLVGFKITRKQKAICGPKPSKLNPHGFNQNRYGYPDPIRGTLRQIALASRTYTRKPRAGVVHRGREWHDKHRRLHSFGSVPSAQKVKQFCELYGYHSALERFALSDVWLEIVSAEECQADLFDLHVPKHHSFLASGMINHNTGKSVAGLHALVRHCYDEDEALALIIAPQIRTGKEGVMYDLIWVLDIWRNGNWDPSDPDRKRRLDDGMGLDYTEPALDAQTKDRVVFIGNRHGGWSKVILISIPYAEVVQKRMKSISPSFVYVDEITELDGDQYFRYVTQQLGRRRGIRGPQQYVASCNPEGPSHWVHRVFIDESVDAETGLRDPDYSVYHIKIAENYDNLPAGYVEGLKKIYKDPIDVARLLEGRWIDRPSGEAIFGKYFRPMIHVRPSLETKDTGEGLRPWAGIPMIVGYDPGPVNYSVHFMQMVPTKEKTVWIVFDELNFVGQFMADQFIVPQILKRMDYWTTFLGSARTSWVHIAPEDAFTHRRHDGSYDAMRLQNLSKGRIRVRSCPQAKQSVTQRVQMTITMLLAETLFISRRCPRTIEAMKLLASERPKEGKYNPNAGLTPKRSPYLHPFDSMTYPPYYFSLMPFMFSLQTEKLNEENSPGVYPLGM